MALKPSLDHFRPRTAEEKQKQEVELLAIEKRTKAAAELVSECLSDKKFEKYRAEYEACR